VRIRNAGGVESYPSCNLLGGELWKRYILGTVGKNKGSEVLYKGNRVDVGEGWTFLTAY